MVTSTVTPGQNQRNFGRLDTWFNVDGGNLLDCLRRRVQIDHTLMDTHLVSVPGVGTLATWRLTCGNNQLLGWHTHRSLNLQILGLGALYKVGADCNINCQKLHESNTLFEGLDVASGQRNADLVDGILAAPVSTFQVTSAPPR